MPIDLLVQPMDATEDSQDTNSFRLKSIYAPAVSVSSLSFPSKISSIPSSLELGRIGLTSESALRTARTTISKIATIITQTHGAENRDWFKAGACMSEPSVCHLSI